MFLLFSIEFTNHLLALFGYIRLDFIILGYIVQC